MISKLWTVLASIPFVLNIQMLIKGNTIALAIAEASVTTTLEQAFDIAFDNQQKLEQYQV